jgi:hypothetical protein
MCAFERESEKGAVGRGRGGDGKRMSRGRGTSRDVTLFPSADIEGMDARRVLCCVDDTDDLTAQTSTGYIVELIANSVAGLGGQVTLGITRHQLLLSEDIPYTSHNSAMCFMALLPPGGAVALRECAVDTIRLQHAAESDPGLCIVEMPCEIDTEFRVEASRLLAFGRKAQTEVCTKEEAYALATSIPWVDLSEHGGTGQGVIGALAGAGLRLGGFDGRFRGTWDLARLMGGGLDADGCAMVPIEGFEEWLGSRVVGDVRVVDMEGNSLSGHLSLVLGDKAKPILYDGALTVVCRLVDGKAWPCAKSDLEEAFAGIPEVSNCRSFAQDNDIEEYRDLFGRGCGNCLYRRLTQRGYRCMHTKEALLETQKGR